MFQKDYWEREELNQRRKPTHPAIVEYVVPKIKVICDHIPVNKETTLLDVGCGNGFFTFHWDKICTVTGVDYSEKMLSMNPVKNVMQMDANQLQFEDNTFDIVFCHAVLHHVDDLGRIIREMARVSKKYVVILEPNRANPFMFLFSAIKKEEHKALKFSRRYLKKITEKNGLQVLNAFSFGMMVPNRMPSFLIPVAGYFNFKQPWGMTNFIIAEKETK